MIFSMHTDRWGPLQAVKAGYSGVEEMEEEEKRVVQFI